MICSTSNQCLLRHHTRAQLAGADAGRTNAGRRSGMRLAMVLLRPGHGLKRAFPSSASILASMRLMRMPTAAPSWQLVRYSPLEEAAPLLLHARAFLSEDHGAEGDVT